MRRFVAQSEESRLLLKKAVDAFRLSARAYFRVLKVSQTIADLEGIPIVEERHVAEALQYRQPA